MLERAMSEQTDNAAATAPRRTLGLFLAIWLTMYNALTVQQTASKRQHSTSASAAAAAALVPSTRELSN